MMLDRRSAVPLHQQFKRKLLNMITSGELPPGTRLPTEREYAALLGISLAPIRQSLADLARQGYLERYKSRGTFVRGRKLEEKITVLPGGEPDTGKFVTLEVLRLERIGAELGHRGSELGLAPCTPVILAPETGADKGRNRYSFFPRTFRPTASPAWRSGIWEEDHNSTRVLFDHYDCAIRRTRHGNRCSAGGRRGGRALGRGGRGAAPARGAPGLRQRPGTSGVCGGPLSG